MTTKQYLKQGRASDDALKRKLARVQRIQKKLSQADREEESFVPRLQLLQADLSQELERLLGYQRELGALIAQLPDCNHRGVLTLRYLCGLRWDQVAERMHYSSRHLYRIHRQALEALEGCRANQKWIA